MNAILPSSKAADDSALITLFENFDDLLTYDELSKWLKTPKSTLEKYVHRREIPYIQITRKNIRFHVGTIKKWLLEKSKGVE